MPSWAAALEAEIRILAVIGAGSFAFWAFSAQAVPHPLAKLFAGDGEARLMKRTGLGLAPRPLQRERWGQCHSAKCFPVGNNNPGRCASASPAGPAWHAG
jgi:hypothetical protein